MEILVRVEITVAEAALRLLGAMIAGRGVPAEEVPAAQAVAVAAEGTRAPERGGELPEGRRASRAAVMEEAIAWARQSGGLWRDAARFCAEHGVDASPQAVKQFARRRGIASLGAPPSAERLAAVALARAANAKRRAAESRREEAPAPPAPAVVAPAEPPGDGVILATREQATRWAFENHVACAEFDLERINRARGERGLHPFLITRTAVRAG
ncbi:MAG: hypothetical protein KGH75_00860 [Rhodospirillales bacterium]|nr:hypothetical protein [Rhodospirillales bacterium]